MFYGRKCLCFAPNFNDILILLALPKKLSFHHSCVINILSIVIIDKKCINPQEDSSVASKQEAGIAIERPELQFQDIPEFSHISSHYRKLNKEFRFHTGKAEELAKAFFSTLQQKPNLKNPNFNELKYHAKKAIELGKKIEAAAMHDETGATAAMYHFFKLVLKVCNMIEKMESDQGKLTYFTRQP